MGGGGGRSVARCLGRNNHGCAAQPSQFQPPPHDCSACQRLRDVPWTARKLECRRWRWRRKLSPQSWRPWGPTRLDHTWGISARPCPTGDSWASRQSRSSPKSQSPDLARTRTEGPSSPPHLTWTPATRQTTPRSQPTTRAHPHTGEIRRHNAPRHAQLAPGGVQGWRACPHAQPGCPTRGAPPAAPARQLHLLTATPRAARRDAPVSMYRTLNEFSNSVCVQNHLSLP